MRPEPGFWKLLWLALARAETEVSAPDRTRIPLFLRARFRLAPRWLAVCARRSPRKALAVFVLAAGLAVLAVHAPAQGCSWRGVAVPGERAHWVCERTA